MKRRPHIPRVDPAIWALLVQARQDTPAETVTETMTKLHDAFCQLRAGTMDDDMFDRLAACINVGLVRAEQIDPVCVAPLAAARDAMIRCDGIRGRHGHYGFDGLGLQAIAAGLEVYEEILRHSTPQQMAEAAGISHHLIRCQAASQARAVAQGEASHGTA
ncbi:hypothetical protein [Variovorax sp. Root434]|uniref:hypothetical protein n=1 Tax=Variovorax sp. Root434 TaxID=1736536 RepID=UPI000701F2BD|nr:hypothetical protein [Variovorax sp. Root434]KQX34660.1 hypothetical protein ASD05_25745 [Variovorax sp. Root434]